jgi:antitoxin component of MazEF toxin-antitoxin module
MTGSRRALEITAPSLAHAQAVATVDLGVHCGTPLPRASGRKLPARRSVRQALMRSCVIMKFIPMYNEALMIKKLSAVGNSLGLIIERPILELLDITKDTPLEVKTDGEALIIRPSKLGRKERIRESTKRMMTVHDKTLRKLAK